MTPMQSLGRMLLANLVCGGTLFGLAVPMTGLGVLLGFTLIVPLAMLVLYFALVIPMAIKNGLAIYRLTYGGLLLIGAVQLAVVAVGLAHVFAALKAAHGMQPTDSDFGEAIAAAAIVTLPFIIGQCLWLRHLLRIHAQPPSNLELDPSKPRFAARLAIVVCAGMGWTLFLAGFVWVVFTKHSPLRWRGDEWLQMGVVYVGTLLGVLWLASQFRFSSSR